MHGWKTHHHFCGPFILSPLKQYFSFTKYPCTPSFHRRSRNRFLRNISVNTIHTNNLFNAFVFKSCLTIYWDGTFYMTYDSLIILTIRFWRLEWWDMYLIDLLTSHISTSEIIVTFTNTNHWVYLDSSLLSCRRKRWSYSRFYNNKYWIILLHHLLQT